MTWPTAALAGIGWPRSLELKARQHARNTFPRWDVAKREDAEEVCFAEMGEGRQGKVRVVHRWGRRQFGTNDWQRVSGASRKVESCCQR